MAETQGAASARALAAADALGLACEVVRHGPVRSLGVNRLSMPDKEVAYAVTGYERGTITPLGSTTARPVVADEAMSGTVSLGAGAHGVAVNVDASELVRALDATVADVTTRRE